MIPGGSFAHFFGAVPAHKVLCIDAEQTAAVFARDARHLLRLYTLDRGFQRDPVTFADMSLFSEYRYSPEKTRKLCEAF